MRNKKASEIFCIFMLQNANANENFFQGFADIYLNSISSHIHEKFMIAKSCPPSALNQRANAQSY